MVMLGGWVSTAPPRPTSQEKNEMADKTAAMRKIVIPKEKRILFLNIFITTPLKAPFAIKWQRMQNTPSLQSTLSAEEEYFLIHPPYSYFLG